MPVRISPHKAAKVLRLFFAGVPQPEIARRCNINQATVSRYVSRLKDEADDSGILEAGKEYGVMHEVDSLRSLAVELHKNKLTVEDAKEGAAILGYFYELGVSPTQHKALVRVISKLKNPDFIPSALKLADLEASTGKTYTRIISHFEQIASEAKKEEEQCSDLKAKRQALTGDIKALTSKKKNLEWELRGLESDIEQRRLEIEREIAGKMQEAEVTADRIGRLMPLLSVLKKLNISDDTLDTYLEEHKKLEELGLTWETFKIMVESAAHGSKEV